MSIAYDRRSRRPGVRCWCEKCSNRRSRATQELAYSPEGAVGGMDSGAPLPSLGTKGYTHAVEKATMRERVKRSATSAGTCAFMAQVSHSLPLEPNLRPAMKMTLGASGSLAS